MEEKVELTHEQEVLKALKEIASGTSWTETYTNDIKTLLTDHQKKSLTVLREISERLLKIQELLEERG